MSQCYVGEIRLFSFGRIPTGWLACNGALLSIAEYETLYVLLGTTYGGDGVNSFALPDLKGRVPIHQGNGRGLFPYVLGEVAGSEKVTLQSAQMPRHSHFFQAMTGAATTDTPGATEIPAATTNTLYVNSLANTTPVTLSSQAIAPFGSSEQHDNMMPTLTLSYCIATNGVFPTPP